MEMQEDGRMLRVEFVEHSREWDRLANMLESANPSHGALNAHAKAGMRDRSKLTKVKVPFEGVLWKMMFLQASTQQLHIVDTLPSADDLSIPFRR